jgi:hypothetical protein
MFSIFTENESEICSLNHQLQFSQKPRRNGQAASDILVPDRSPSSRLARSPSSIGSRPGGFVADFHMGSSLCV